MNRHLSQKIIVLSFLSIILVLYIHSGFHDTPNEIHGMAFNQYLQEAISGQLGRLAVPLFFMISGYLFFYRCDSLQKVWAKQKKRARTIGIPYLISAWFLPLFYVLMGLIPQTRIFVNSSDNSFFVGNLYEILYRLYWDSDSGTPIGFHLWFLRDLIVIVVLAPLLYLIRKYESKGYITCASLLILSFFLSTSVISSLLWFTLGSYFLNKISCNKSLWIPLLFLYISFSIIELVQPSNFLKGINLPLKAIGIIAIWNLYDYFISDSFDLQKHRILATICSYTFFIYLFHEPTLNIVRKLIALPFHHSSFGYAVSYLASPWMFAMVWIIVGMAFKRAFPKVYGICVGGR